MLSRICQQLQGRHSVSSIGSLLSCQSWRYSSGKSGDKDKNDESMPGDKEEKAAGPLSEADDEFGMDDFLTTHEEEEMDLETSLTELEEKEEVTPEIASDLVNRMVNATARNLEKRMSVRESVLPSITPHTISVLRASRICTNVVHASSSDAVPYPIEKRVTAELHVDRLGLSASACAALLELSGPRVRENGTWIKLSCDKFPTKEENRAYIVSRLHLLVSAAQNAVGQSVDLTPLNTWDDVVREVERQAAEEIDEAGSVQRVLGDM